MTKVDANSKYVAMGYDSGNDLPVPLSTDSVTGYLRATVTSISSGTPSAQTSSIDANSKYVSMGVDGSGNILPIIVNTNGSLRCTE